VTPSAGAPPSAAFGDSFPRKREKDLTARLSLALLCPPCPRGPRSPTALGGDELEIIVHDALSAFADLQGQLLVAEFG